MAYKADFGVAEVKPIQLKAMPNQHTPLGMDEWNEPVLPTKLIRNKKL
jgi:hypothetical protein